MTDALEMARDAFDWVGTQAVDVAGGQIWCEAGEPLDEFYSGTAGVLWGCAEAMAAGLDTSAVAAGACARLEYLAEHGEPSLDNGLFTGWAGVAAALRAWGSLVGDATAQAAAADVRAQIAERILTHDADPNRCTDIISGDAGMLLELLAHASGEHDEAAHRLADGLVALAEPGHGGLHWRMTADTPGVAPGFSHGTSGVAYSLLIAGQRLARPDLIEVAIRGAEALLAAGNTSDGWLLPLAIPRGWHRPETFFGWCHGPTGTIALLAALGDAVPDARWTGALQACLRAIAASGLPQRIYPGFWDNLGRCCGTASVGTMLLTRYQATGDPGLLAWAERLAEDVMQRADTRPTGVAWSNTEFTRTPPELPPEPGFMQGAAGIGGWLARLAALQSGRPAGSPSYV